MDSEALLGLQLLSVSVLFTGCCHLNHVGSVIYLFIFSIGTCFRFECREGTFAWLMVQLFCMGVLICMENAEGSLNSIKLDRLSSECFVFIGLLFSSRTCLAGLTAPLKLNEISIMCKRGLYDIYKPDYEPNKITGTLTLLRKK